MKETTFGVYCPKIGHGNPAAAIAIAKILKRLYPHTSLQVNIYEGWGVELLRVLHQLISQNPFFLDEYTENSEQYREGIGGFAIGLSQLESWLSSERLRQFKGKQLAEVGIFVQEHLLRILPRELLERWFPGGIFLYIPDVYPKQSAVEVLKVLKEKEFVIPLVWNTQALEELQSAGLNPILCKPVLPFGLVEKQTIEGKINHRKRVLKSSGSGIPEAILNLVIESRKKGEILEVWLPNEVILYDDNNPQGVKKTNIPNDLEEYHKNFYHSLLDAGEIISYPSEMVQVVSSLLSSGWRGKFRVLPPRGAHEKRNLAWLSNFLSPTPEKDGTYVFDFSQSEANKLIESLIESLGSRDLVSVIETNKRERPQRLAISSEALKLPFLPPPAIRQELVVASSEELKEERDWREIIGIHLRTGKRLEGEVFYQQLERVIKIAGERRVRYVTIHLEDLPSNIAEAREKLSNLNQLGLRQNVFLLLENVAPRVDQKLEKWQYSLIEFMREFKNDLKGWQNIGFCLDFAHLGLAEPEVLEILQKVFETHLTGTYNLNNVLTEEQLSLLGNFIHVLRRTETIHWSRTKIGSQRQKFFDLFSKINSFVGGKLRIQALYNFLQNSLSAHYSLASDDNFYVMILDFLYQLGWLGTVVIESPDIGEVVRERHFPHQGEINLLKGQLGLIESITLGDFFMQAGFNKIEADDLVGFVFNGFERSRISRRLFSFLIEQLPQIRRFYQKETGEDFRRELNKGLYLRHILRAILWGDFLFDDLKKANLLREEDYHTFMWSIALHDVLELNVGNETKKQDEITEILNLPNVIKIIIDTISILTPSPLAKAELSYEERKAEEFSRLLELWNSGNKLPLLVEICDILANLDETIDELKLGIQDEKAKPLLRRYFVWQVRTQIIRDLFKEETEVTQLLEERLKVIKDFLGDSLFWEISDRIVTDKEKEEILNQIKTHRSFEYQFNGKKAQYSIDGVVILDNEIYLVRRVNGDTVEILSLSKLVEWIKSGYEVSKVPPWEMLCRKIEKGKEVWTNSPYTSSLKNPLIILHNTEAGNRLTLIAKSKN